LIVAVECASLHIMTASLLPFLLFILPVLQDAPRSVNWCEEGQMVIIPDGRDGAVTFVDGKFCAVLPYSEKYATRWVYDMIEPKYPKFGR
jgi:hypothetical protein